MVFDRADLGEGERLSLEALFGRHLRGRLPDVHGDELPLLFFRGGVHRLHESGSLRLVLRGKLLRRLGGGRRLGGFAISSLLRGSGSLSVSSGPRDLLRLGLGRSEFRGSGSRLGVRGGGGGVGFRLRLGVLLRLFSRRVGSGSLSLRGGSIRLRSLRGDGGVLLRGRVRSRFLDARGLGLGLLRRLRGGVNRRRLGLCRGGRLALASHGHNPLKLHLLHLESHHLILLLLDVRLAHALQLEILDLELLELKKRGVLRLQLRELRAHVRAGRALGRVLQIGDFLAHGANLGRTGGGGVGGEHSTKLVLRASELLLVTRSLCHHGGELLMALAGKDGRATCVRSA